MLTTRRAREAFLVVLAAALFWALFAGIGYPLTGNPEFIYMPPVTYGVVVVIWVLTWLGFEWVQRGND